MDQIVFIRCQTFKISWIGIWRKKKRSANNNSFLCITLSIFCLSQPLWGKNTYLFICVTTMPEVLRRAITSIYTIYTLLLYMAKTSWPSWSRACCCLSVYNYYIVCVFGLRTYLIRLYVKRFKSLSKYYPAECSRSNKYLLLVLHNLIMVFVCPAIVKPWWRQF